MKISILLVTLLLSLNAAKAGPMPVGANTRPIYGGSQRPTPEWAKAHPKLTTAQTAIVPHTCNKNLHSKRCVKKCIIQATKTQPTGLPTMWHVRGGSAFPVRNKQAEKVILDLIYPAKTARKRQVQAVIKTN
ncbi:MAG: hypothetical protein K2Y32_11980 [Candidatus Obscuribacterales bacterium]|jgi:hypothetical protein|nr:hypothetical protein [Candidatus Obscuribacterales bacterium]